MTTLARRNIPENNAPRSIEAEAALLGSLILEGEIRMPEVGDIVSAADFYKPAHAAIFTALKAIHDAKKPIEILTLQLWLDERRQLDQIGGMDYLIELGDSVPSASLASHYAIIVAEKSARRAAIEMHAKRLLAWQSDADPVDEMLDADAAETSALASRGARSPEAQSIGEILQAAFDDLTAIDSETKLGIQTGILAFDAMTGGFRAGELIIVAGRPSMGKSIFGQQIAQHASHFCDIPTGFFSLEMSKAELSHRFFMSLGDVHGQSIKRRKFASVEYESMRDLTANAKETPLFVDDRPGLNVNQIRASARRMARRGARLIVIDYLQLMGSSGSARAENREQEVAAISRGLKAIARELNVPVVCMSQLNRMPETRADNRPRMSDLRESGSIEQDADVVVLLHRDDYYKKSDPQYVHTNITEAILAKQRNGATGTVEMTFDGPHVRFKNYTPPPMSGSHFPQN